MSFDSGSREPRHSTQRSTRPSGPARPRSTPRSSTRSSSHSNMRPRNAYDRNDPYNRYDNHDTYNNERHNELRKRYYANSRGSASRPVNQPSRRPNARPVYSDGRKRRRSKKQDQQRLSLLIVIVFVILLILVLALTKCGRSNEPIEEASVPIEDTSDSVIVEESSIPDSDPEPLIPTMEGLANVDSISASATYYYTYGTHYNITGTTPEIDNVRTVHLVLRSLNREEDVYSYELAWATDGDGIQFESSEMINNGINLEVLPTGHYAWLLKIHLRDGSDVYRNIVDDTDQEPICYYTITQNDTNREILMENARDSIHNTEYYGVTIKECELPDTVYDIVVDAGHGGNDGGAVGGDYTEAELTLKCAFLLKEDLEALGYKVCLSRDGTEPDDEWMAYTMYDNPDGRVTKACASRAKIGVSLHLNALDKHLDIGGIQVYCTARGNYDLAAEIAKELKANTNCDYATSTYNQKTDGVYIKCENEFNPADILSNRDALFMIRELGGVATGAYMAGTQYYAENIYRDSSQGVESLLLELGYITVDKDREDIANNTDHYAQGICNAIDTIVKQTAQETVSLPADDSSEPVTTVTPIIPTP